MELIDRLNALSSKVSEQKAVISTEEATKTALIMPFLSSVLGYDVFNPLEVVPEFTADVGLKKGEKIDYAIMRDGVVQILIECKTVGQPLSLENASQLYRYFAVTNARIAMLTNGQIYQFYTDLDSKNRMDSTPFLVLDVCDVDPALVPELTKLSKSEFDLDSVIDAAESLKYVGSIKRAISSQFKEPEDEWVKYFTAQVYKGPFTQRVREQFTPLVKRAAAQFLNDQVNSRLKTALGSDGYSPAVVPEASDSRATPSGPDNRDDETDPGDGIETTAVELAGYAVVKAIGCSEVKPDRIVGRDSKSYFAILLDDNNRKPIARLHFNRDSHRYIGLLDAEKVETRYPVQTVDDIYAFSEQIREAVRRYM